MGRPAGTARSRALTGSASGGPLGEKSSGTAGGMYTRN